MDDRLERLERLHALHQRGALTDAEFETEKARTLTPENGASRRSLKVILAAGAAVIAVIAIAAVWWGREAPPTDHAPIAEKSVPKPITPQQPAATPTPSPQELLASAGRTAFSESGGVRLRPEKLIPVGTHLAVVGVGEGDGSHVSAGTLAVQYVDRTETGLSKFGPILSEQTGSMGSIGGWTLRRDLGPRPIIALDGGGTWQGCTSGGATLIELDDDRPRTLASFIPTSFQDDSASDHGPSYEGKIVRSGRDISIRYKGSVNATITLRRIGSKLVPDRPLPTGC